MRHKRLITYPGMICASQSLFRDTGRCDCFRTARYSRRGISVSIPLQGHRPMRPGGVTPNPGGGVSLNPSSGTPADATPPRMPSWDGASRSVSIPLQGHRPMRHSRRVHSTARCSRNGLNPSSGTPADATRGYGHPARGAADGSQSLFRDTGRCDRYPWSRQRRVWGIVSIPLQGHRPMRLSRAWAMFGLGRSLSQSLFRDTGRCDEQNYRLAE